MDEYHLFIFSVLSLLSLVLIFKLVRHGKEINLPPSPPSLPVIGHLHLIKVPVHRALQRLSSKYGPIMALRFGSRSVVIVTSPSAVEECFTKNDIILANRPRLLSRKYFDYDCTTLGTAPYGRLWRDLRRITTLQLFSTSRLNAVMGLRQDEVRSLIKNLFQDCTQDFTRVEMKSRTQGLSFNILMRMVADKHIYGTEVEDFSEARKFRAVIRDMFEVSGTSNPSDFIPFLRWVDFHGLKKRLLKLQIETDSFVQTLIEERRNKRHDSSSHERNAETFIDGMLSLQEMEPEYYTDDIIKGNVLVRIIHIN